MKSRYYSVTNERRQHNHTIHKTSIEITRTNRSPKLLTSESPPHQRSINTPQKTINQFTIYNVNAINSISHSQEFKHAFEPLKKGQLVQQKSTLNFKLKKIQSFEERQRYLINQSKINVIQFLNKKSLQSLQVQNKNLYKTQYSKIGRKKFEMQKKSEKNHKIQDYQKIEFERNESSKQIKSLFEPFCEQKLIQKYKQLKNTNTKNNPFNLINKLYQIDAISAKKIDFLIRDISQDPKTKSPQTLEAKIYKMINKPPDYDKVRRILLNKKVSNDQAQNKVQNKVQNKESLQLDAKRQQVKYKIKMKPKDIYKMKKASIEQRKEQPVKQKQPSVITRNYEKQENLSKKINSNPIIQQYNQRQITIPPPKNLQTNNYLIYQVITTIKLKSPNKLLEPFKKKDYPGKVHLSSNMKMASQIASLTKIMTCIVVIEICERLSIDPNIEKYKIGVFETTIGGTSAQINFGQIYTINELLHGLMLPSGNDASLALARWGGNVLLLNELQGSKKWLIDKTQIGQMFQWSLQNKCIRYKHEKIKPHRCYNRFLAEMNKKARLLGLTKTSYANSHGLSNPLNKSCCIDIAMLCEYSMKNSYFRRIVSCKQFKTTIQKQIIVSQQIKVRSNKNIDPQYVNLAENIQDKNIIAQNQQQQQDDQQEEEQLQLLKKSQYIKQEVQWINTHRLLHKKQQYIGIKTGVTASAGPCLASFVKILDRNFIIVVLNSKKLSSRFSDTQILKKWIIEKQKMIKYEHREQIGVFQQ